MNNTSLLWVLCGLAAYALPLFRWLLLPAFVALHFAQVAVASNLRDLACYLLVLVFAVDKLLSAVLRILPTPVLGSVRFRETSPYRAEE